MTPTSVLLRSACCLTDIKVPVGHLLVDEGDDWGSLRFRCPACGTFRLVRIPARTVSILLAAGARQPHVPLTRREVSRFAADLLVATPERVFEELGR